MQKRVLIIEDDQSHYEKARDILRSYNLIVYPDSDIEYKKFAIILRTYGEQKVEGNLKKIEEFICKYEFDFIILDRSFTDALKDNSGLLVEEYILKKLFPSTDICYLSYFPKEYGVENYIEKDDSASWETNLFQKVVTKLIPRTDAEAKIPELTEKQPLGTESASTSQTSAYEKSRKVIDPPKSLQKIVEVERYKLLPATFYWVDTIIRYCFYLTLIVLFLYGVYFLQYSLLNYHENPIQVAEHTFIVFLPFLIGCGFFVFYTKALSGYIKQKGIDDTDFENSGNLMKLTKKLFVSSLLSYIFIKLIELLELENTKSEAVKRFKEKYSDIPDIYLIYLVIAFIGILILYYMYIDRNHSSKKTD